MKSLVQESQGDPWERYDYSLCRSCGERIYWLKNERTGKLAPINAAPVENGNIEVDVGAKTYRVLGKQERARSAYPLLHTNHFMTCPAAIAWARHGGSGMRGRRNPHGRE